MMMLKKSLLGVRGASKKLMVLSSQQQRMSKSTHHVQVGENRSVAYKQMPGTKQPTIVHVPGLHSYAHMNGMTAKSILRLVELMVLGYNL